MGQFKTIAGYILIEFLVPDLGYARFQLILGMDKTSYKKRSALSSSGTDSASHVGRSHSTTTSSTGTAAAITPVAVAKKPKAKSLTM